MRIAVTVWILALLGSASAEPPITAIQHLTRGRRWQTATQYEKAIAEFEQGYLLDERPLFLYYMATSYDRLSSVATKSASEVLDSKQRALELYTSFAIKASPEEFGLDVARNRMEPLRQEIKELAGQLADREASTKILNENIQLLLTEIRTLRELLLRRSSGERAATLVH